MLIAILPLAGVLIGAALQYAFGRSLEARKQLSTQRAQAYIDFFRAIAALAQQRSKDNLALAADSKSRICVYGSANVISKLADFERSGAVLTTDAGRIALLALLGVMRNDVTFDAGALKDDDLFRILFGSS